MKQEILIPALSGAEIKEKSPPPIGRRTFLMELLGEFFHADFNTADGFLFAQNVAKVT
jgi:hypothetical protein